MHYVKEHTTIPVPDVLFYDPDWDRKVGGEWMLMRYIDGINPVYLWRTLTDDQWEALCIFIADIWSQLMRLRFKFVGSIYEQQVESESWYFIGSMTYLPGHVEFCERPLRACVPLRASICICVCERDMIESSSSLPTQLDYPDVRKCSRHVNCALEITNLVNSSMNEVVGHCRARGISES
ncbi:hypothetical protein EDD85DRAFT_143878 [Armillaria nabsnona]|nr:hypothetical protein EDD85DRAFT_143878 [Armillaria nabsnona]